MRSSATQVLKLKLEVVKLLAERAEFSQRSAEFCVPDVVDKLADSKCAASAADALTAVAEAVGLDYVAVHTVEFAMGQKNPKVQSEALLWLSTAIREFGFV